MYCHYDTIDIKTKLLVFLDPTIVSDRKSTLKDSQTTNLSVLWTKTLLDYRCDTLRGDYWAGEDNAIKVKYP